MLTLRLWQRADELDLYKKIGGDGSDPSTLTSFGNMIQKTSKPRAEAKNMTPYHQILNNYLIALPLDKCRVLV